MLLPLKKAVVSFAWKNRCLGILQNLRLVRFATGTSLGYQEGRSAINGYPDGSTLPVSQVKLSWVNQNGSLHYTPCLVWFWPRSVELFARALLYKCLWIIFWSQRKPFLMVVVGDSPSRMDGSNPVVRTCCPWADHQSYACCGTRCLAWMVWGGRFWGKLTWGQKSMAQTPKGRELYRAYINQYMGPVPCTFTLGVPLWKVENFTLRSDIPRLWSAKLVGWGIHEMRVSKRFCDMGTMNWFPSFVFFP